MNRILLGALSALLCLHLASAEAAGLSCSAQAAAKKLSGAARTSFMGKCQREARATCAIAAAKKKLAGAARTSFTEKCVRDAVGG